MKNTDKASGSLIKILGICIILILLTSVGVMATNAKLVSVKIILSNNYEMTVLTSKTRISEILEENHIELEDDENVTPGIEEDLTANNTIRISTEKEEGLAEAPETTVTKEEILQSYGTIVEKIVTEQVAIPFETITKESTSGSGEKQNRVVQKGKDGLKEVVYKVKYQNEIEIEKTEISTTTIKEPVNKIVEVSTIQVTSRSSAPRTERAGDVKYPITSSQLSVVWAVVMQEGGSSYDSALAVVSSAVNRVNSSRWRYSKDNSIYGQFTRPGQYCYTIDNHWRKYLGGNVPEYVKQAVEDAMYGKTNHPYTSFRSYSTGPECVKIGGNYYYGS